MSLCAQAALSSSLAAGGSLAQQYASLQADRASLTSLYSDMLAEGDEALTRLEGLIAATRSSRQRELAQLMAATGGAGGGTAAAAAVAAAQADGPVSSSVAGAVISSSRILSNSSSSGSPSVLRSPSLHNRSSPQPIRLHSATTPGRAYLAPPPTGRTPAAAQRPPTPDRYTRPRTRHTASQALWQVQHALWWCRRCQLTQCAARSHESQAIYSDASCVVSCAPSPHSLMLATAAGAATAAAAAAGATLMAQAWTAHLL